MRIRSWIQVGINVFVGNLFLKQSKGLHTKSPCPNIRTMIAYQSLSMAPAKDAWNDWKAPSMKLDNASNYHQDVYRCCLSAISCQIIFFSFGWNLCILNTFLILQCRNSQKNSQSPGGIISFVDRASKAETSTKGAFCMLKIQSFVVELHRCIWGRCLIIQTIRKDCFICRLFR